MSDDIDDDRDYWSDPDLAHDREEDMRMQRDVREGWARWETFPGTNIERLVYLSSDHGLTPKAEAKVLDRIIDAANNKGGA